MGPKKKAASTSKSKRGGAKVELSWQNEERLRRLLLNKGAGAGARVDESEGVSVSREQKAKKLKSIYEELSCSGFRDDDIERALSCLNPATLTLEVALDWLCLNLSPTQLPIQFRDTSSLSLTQSHTEGASVTVVSTAQLNWTPPTPTHTSTSLDQFQLSTKPLSHHHSLLLHDPSQAHWIRQYMDNQQQLESDTWEDMFSDEGSSKKVAEPRSYGSIVEEYQSARLEAIAAKEKGDKKSQEAASNKIRMLKQEMSFLGEGDILLSDIGTVKPPDSGYKVATSIDAMDDSSTHKVGLEHCLKDEATVNSNPVNEVTAFEEEPGDTELGNFFMEDGSLNAALPPEILMIQNKAKARSSPSSKDLEKLEGIWKKGDSPRIPKAVLHQLCQRSGWDPPKFDKVGKKGNGFSYSVSVLRKSTGRGKSRKAGGLITLQLPGQDEKFESAEEAQNTVAAFALWRLFPDIPIQFCIREPYASLVVKWEEGESPNMIEDDMNDRRAGFVDSLLDADSSIEMSSVDVADSSQQFEVSELSNEKFSAAGPQSRSFSKEESILLSQELNAKQKTPRYKSMLEARSALPIFKAKNEILQSLKQNNVIVVCGETGSGKTTQVPQYILDDMIVSGHGANCNIVCTQPRRIAAISVAERVADERSEPAPGVDGSLVGYQVRLDSARNDRTKLLFCTTGILLRQIVV